MQDTDTCHTETQTSTLKHNYNNKSNTNCLNFGRVLAQFSKITKLEPGINLCSSKHCLFKCIYLLIIHHIKSSVLFINFVFVVYVIEDIFTMLLKAKHM